MARYIDETSQQPVVVTVSLLRTTKEVRQLMIAIAKEAPKAKPFRSYRQKGRLGRIFDQLEALGRVEASEESHGEVPL